MNCRQWPCRAIATAKPVVWMVPARKGCLANGIRVEITQQMCGQCDASERVPHRVPTDANTGVDFMTESDPLKAPVDLAGLAEHNDDSIVSRTLLKKPSGTVTVFAFAAGQALSEHTAPFDALLQLLEGQARVVIDGLTHVVAAGQMLRLPANVPHSVAADEPFKMLLIMLR